MLKGVAFPTVAFGELGLTDKSSTPGNATVNAIRGRAAIAPGASTCVITNNLVKPTSTVLALRSGAGSGSTTIVRAVASAGSFAVFASGVAALALPFDFLVFN
jgi:hypothetical protein